MAYSTRRALRLATKDEEDHGDSSQNLVDNSVDEKSKSSGRVYLTRRRDSRDESGTDDEDEDQPHHRTLRRSNRIKEIVLAQAFPIDEMPELDMYSRVKSGNRKRYNDDGLRVRKPRKSSGDVNGSSTANGTNHEGTEGAEESSSEEEAERGHRSYNLRQHRAQPQYFVIQQRERRPRQSHVHIGTHRRHSRVHSRPHHHDEFSTTPSSSEAEMNKRVKRTRNEDQEDRFERRRVRSMACARREVLPMNFTNADLELLGLKDRIRAGQTVADIDPMYLDKSTGFEQVGGLDNHIKQLKEMVVFPLLYPDMFTRFNITPPRGVLFFGPPGTGKTLLARALANECSRAGGRRVAFFMRRGADCLSKWVGESERQLRLLFDQAYQLRPSIIFFDEIDGLAPVRSSRQDQIHSSIVSTLLALMDGLDSRQEVIVIGATNRIDSIDPALRRPGRFDREFAFRLPNRNSRREILNIHTKSWQPNLSNQMLDALSEKTVGYSGADLRGLCTEAVLNSIRRRYPQIYSSNERLLIDSSQLKPNCRDFEVALSNTTPAAARSRQPSSWPLAENIKPLLISQLQMVLNQVANVFPLFNPPKVMEVEGGMVTPSDSKSVKSEFAHPSFQIAANHNIYRPRLLLCGEATKGHVSHLAPAVLHALEEFQVHILSVATIFGAADYRTPEDAVQHIVGEALRTAPCILFMPDIDQLFEITSHQLRVVLRLVLSSIKPDLPILIFATCRKSSETVFSVNFEDDWPRSLFRLELGQTFDMRDPDYNERKLFFAPIFKLKPESCLSSQSNGSSSPSSVEPLPVAPTQPASIHLSEAEKASLFLKEEVILREMRQFLRDVLNRLLRDRRFGVFSRPVDSEDAPDYYEIITNPMDLSQMMTKIDRHEYQCVADFVADIDLIARNGLEYNPETDQNSRQVRHRACALRDACAGLIDSELDPDFERQCLQIKQSRSERGIDAKKTAPAFIYTPGTANNQERGNGSITPSQGENASSSHSPPKPQPHPASATVALVQMQQELTQGSVASSNSMISPVPSRSRELRSSTSRQSVPRPSNFLSPVGSAKKRKVETIQSDEAIQPSFSTYCLRMAGSVKQQEEMEGLLEKFSKTLTENWPVEELHRLAMVLERTSVQFYNAADLIQGYEAVYSNELNSLSLKLGDEYLPV